MEIGKAVLACEIDATGAKAGAVAVNQAMDSVKDKGVSTTKSVDSSFSGLDKTLARLKGTLLGLAGGFALTSVVSGITQTADAFNLVQGKLAQVTKTTEQLHSAYQSVFDISQVTGTSLDATSQLAMKSIRNFVAMGQSQATAQKQGLEFTETLQKALRVSNASTAEASSLVLQLGQALQSGRLQGDEFRSVMESGGRVVQALAEYTGKSTAELRLMAEQGKITSSIIVASMRSAASSIDEEFIKVPKTFSLVFGEISNALTQYIGLANQASGVGGSLISVLESLAKNFNAVANSVLAVSSLFALKYVSGILLANTAGLGFVGTLTSISSGLLALVGGPIGAAILAVGGLTYAISSFNDKQKEHQKELEKSAEEVKGLTKELEEFDDTLQKTLVAGKLPDLDQAFVKWAEGLSIVADKNRELLALQEQLKQKQEEITQPTSFNLGNDYQSLSDGISQASIEASDLNKEISSLSPAIEEASTELKVLGTVISVDNIPQLVELRQKIQDLKTLDMGINPKQISDQITNLIGSNKWIEQYRDLVEMTNEISAANTRLKKEAENAGKSESDLAKQLLARFKAMADSAGIPTQLTAATIKLAEGNVQYAHSTEVAKNAEKNRNQQLQETKKKLDEARKAQEDAAHAISDLLEKQDPLLRLETEYNRQKQLVIASLYKYNSVGQLVKITDTERARILEILTKDYEDNIAKTKESTNSVEQLRLKYDNVYAAEQRRKLALKELNETLGQGAENADLYRLALEKIDDAYAQETKTGEYAEQQVAKYSAQVDESSKVLENAAQNIQSSFSDFFYNIFDKGVKSFKDLGKGILDIFKRTLAEMATLAIAKPIIVPIVQSLGSSLGIGNTGQLLGNMFGQDTGTQGGSLGSGNLFTNLFSGLGNTISGGIQGLGNVLSGISSWFGGGLNSAAASSYGVLNTTTGFAPTFGGGLASTGAGMAGNFFGGAWNGFTSGLSSLGSGSIMQGMGQMLPFVGQVIAGAQLINSLTNGGLFGTSWKPTGTQGFNVGLSDSGVTGNSFYTESHKRSLFRGREWRTVSQALGSDTQSQFEQLIDSIKEAMTNLASSLSTSIPDLISGSFKQVTDKNGKVTQQISTVLGRTYNESVEAFQKRIQAENMLAIIGQVSEEAGSIANRFRSNAEDLLDAATLMAGAQKDLQSGVELLGDGTTLSGVVDLMQELAKQGESLTDAYTRLSSSTILYQKFLDIINVSVSQTGAQLVQFAGDITDAAGGIDNASRLYNSFFDSYMSEEEKRQYQLQQLRSQADKEVADLGASGTGLTFTNFRAAFEQALPSLSADQVKEWLEAGEALAAVANVLGSLGEGAITLSDGLSQYADTFTEYNNQLQLAGRTATQVLFDSVQPLYDAAGALDGTTQSESALISLLSQRYEMELQYLDMINSAQSTINSTIDQSIERIRLSQMNDEEQYNYFRDQANSLSEYLNTLSDPTQIQDTIGRLNDLQSQAWNVLTEDQQAAMADDFVSFLEGIRTQAQDRLQVAQETVQQQNESIAAAIETAMQRVADQQAAAAQAQQEAAAQQVQAAQGMQQAVNSLVTTPVVVDIGDIGRGRNDFDVGGINP